jgi:hypothetical protein
MKPWYRSLSVVVGMCALVGMAFGQQNSGFLGGTYSKLGEVQSPSGQKVKRWIAPVVSASNFQQVLLEKTILYPQPRSTDQISAATLNEVAAYLDEAIRRELSGIVKLAAEPGPKTLRFRPAITAAAVKDMGLKPYQYLPVAFILTAGKTSKDALLALEYELQDTDSNEVVGAGMRESTGVQVKSTSEKLTLAHFKPIIDGWAKDMRAFVEAAKLPK